MDNQIRDNIGQEAYNARFFRSGLTGIPWSELPETVKESHRAMSDASIKAFLDNPGEDLRFPNATQELVDLLKVSDQPAAVVLDQFLAAFATNAVQSYISFLPASYGNDEILEKLRDQSDVMNFWDDDDEEEEED